MIIDANIRISPVELQRANRSSVELADGFGDFLGTLGDFWVEPDLCLTD